MFDYLFYSMHIILTHMEYAVLSNGRGGGSTTCIKKKYTVHEIIITVHVVKINTLLCLEEEKILVRKATPLKYL